MHIQQKRIGLILAALLAGGASAQTATLQLGPWGGGADGVVRVSQYDALPVVVSVQGAEHDQAVAPEPLQFKDDQYPTLVLTPDAGGEPIRVPMHTLEPMIQPSQSFEMNVNGAQRTVHTTPSAQWMGDLRELKPGLPDGAYAVTLELPGVEVQGGPTPAVLGKVTLADARELDGPRGEGTVWIEATPMDDDPAFAGQVRCALTLHNQTEHDITVDAYVDFGGDADAAAPWSTLITPERFVPGGWSAEFFGFCGTGLSQVTLAAGESHALQPGGASGGIFRYTLSYGVVGSEPAEFGHAVSPALAGPGVDDTE